MKYIQSWESFNENFTDTEITIDSIEEFVDIAGFSSNEQEIIIDWWNKNRNEYIINYFPFITNEPILGGFIGDNTIAINSKMRSVPKEMLLFIALHESKHGDQTKKGTFEDGYFQSVVDGDEEKFLDNYQSLEKDANDYAINAMKEIGYDSFINMMERMIRGNEHQGKLVYKMMTKDIEKHHPKTFTELIKKQIK